MYIYGRGKGAYIGEGWACTREMSGRVHGRGVCHVHGRRVCRVHGRRVCVYKRNGVSVYTGEGYVCTKERGERVHGTPPVVYIRNGKRVRKLEKRKE